MGAFQSCGDDSWRFSRMEVKEMRGELAELRSELRQLDRKIALSTTDPITRQQWVRRKAKLENDIKVGQAELSRRTGKSEVEDD